MKNKNQMKKIGIFLSVSFLSGILWAKGNGTTAGVALLQTGSARASALGNAFSAVSNDIGAMDFNPASLATLNSGQVSFQHQTGSFDDSLTQLNMGFLLPKGNLGLSVGRYSAGDVKLFDGVNPSRTVNAQEDLLFGIGTGFKFQQIALGVNLRYLSSKLAETTKANATLLDVGGSVPLSSQLRFGLSGTLLRSAIKYGTQSEDLPQILRAGLTFKSSVELNETNLPYMLSVDAPYDLQSRKSSEAIGLEVPVGFMAFRMGYKFKNDLEGFSIGTGFMFKNSSLDYSFGLINKDFDSQHKISFAMRFGDDKKPGNILFSR